MFGLIICFKNLLGPTNISVFNTAEGKKKKVLILNFLFIRRHFDLSWNVAFLQRVQKVTSVDCNWLISIHVVNLVSWYLIDIQLDNFREFKQIATATSTTAVVDAVSWGEYVS